MAVKVSYAEGRYEDYDNTKYVEGRIYYLIDDNGNTYIYLNGEEYTGVDGSAEPDKIEFPDEITVTKTVGNYEAGKVIPRDTNLLDLITNMLAQDINPVRKDVPAVAFDNIGWVKAHEIGTTINLTYKVTLSTGSYEIPGTEPLRTQDAGVTAIDSDWSITTTAQGIDGSNQSEGTLGSYRFTNTTTYVSLTAVATGSEGAIPLTYLNKPYPNPEVQYQEGATYSNTTSNASCYRACFYGYTANASPDYSNLTSDQIRSLGGNGSYKSIPPKLPTTSGTTISTLKQLFFAAPHNKYHTITVKNQDNIPQNLKGPYNVYVEGKDHFTAIEYDVWYLYNADPSHDQILTITAR